MAQVILSANDEVLLSEALAANDELSKVLESHKQLCALADARLAQPRVPRSSA